MGRGRDIDSNQEYLDEKKSIVENTVEKSNDVSFSCREGCVVVGGII